LWSARDLLGYAIRAGEHAAGHVEDLVFDPDTWSVRSIVVELRNGRVRHVLLDPSAVDRIHWLGATVHTHLTKAEITASPDLILGPIAA
jgi:hypothetical protein